MPLYNIVWEIDIEADDPRAAAQEARDIQRRTDSTATVFDVWTINKHGGDTGVRVDLLLEETEDYEL